MVPKRIADLRNGKRTPRKPSKKFCLTTTMDKVIYDDAAANTTRNRCRKSKHRLLKTARPTGAYESNKIKGRLNSKKKIVDTRFEISTNVVQTSYPSVSRGNSPENVPEKQRKVEKTDERLIVSRGEITAFLDLGENRDVRAFLAEDQCFTISDKYLLAMVFTYMKRAQLAVDEYSEINFFLALYLANEIEEDEDDYKFEILPWALDDEWRELFPDFQLAKQQLWTKMDYRAMVSKSCCEEVISLAPHHWFWRRERKAHHGGAYRNYSGDIRFPRGPNMSPEPQCALCRVDDCNVSLTLSEELDWESGAQQTMEENYDRVVPCGDASAHPCRASPSSATVPTCETFELSKDSGIFCEDHNSDDEPIVLIGLLSSGTSTDSPVVTRGAAFDMDGLRNSLDDKDAVWD